MTDKQTTPDRIAAELARTAVALGPDVTFDCKGCRMLEATLRYRAALERLAEYPWSQQHEECYVEDGALYGSATATDAYERSATDASLRITVLPIEEEPAGLGLSVNAFNPGHLWP